MTFLTAALLTVCLCVPALASGECQHDWSNADGICALCGFECGHPSWVHLNFWGEHTCSTCSYSEPCVDKDGDFYCDSDGTELDVIRAAGGCEHLISFTDSSLYAYDDSTHYLVCGECFARVDLQFAYRHTFGDEYGDLYIHTDDCPVCAVLSSDPDCCLLPVDALAFSDCEFLMGDIDAAIGSGIVILCYRDDGHYLYCTDCGAYSPFAVFIGEDSPHTGSDCVVCATFSGDGLDIVPFPTASSGVLPTITALVTSSIAWLSSFALCIVSDPLFLIFVCCIFVGLGIALIKRCIHL